MLKIIGRKTSSNVMKVLWACVELGLDFEREDLGGPFGGNDSPEYQALNPNGVVPTIVEDDFVLWESNSIVRYLGESEYLAGPDITMGDLAPAPFVFRWFTMAIEREVYPNLKRWYDSLAARPVFKKIVIDIGLQ